MGFILEASSSLFFLRYKVGARVGNDPVEEGHRLRW